MKPEDERELFSLLRRIDRRLTTIGCWLIGGAAVFVAIHVYEDAKGIYGELIATLISIAVCVGIGWYFVRRLNDD